MCRNNHGRSSYAMQVFRDTMTPKCKLISSEELDGLVINEGRVFDTLIFWCNYKGLHFSLTWGLPSNEDDIDTIQYDFVRGILFFLKKYDEKYAIDKPLYRLFKKLDS